MTSGYPVQTIAMRKDWNLDEWVAQKIVRSPVGEDVFPGVRKAEIVYTDAASSPYSSKEGMVAAGVLPLGIWGGDFDVRASSEHGRLNGECVSTLIAKAIGLRDDPTIRLILEYILIRDAGRMSAEGDIYRLVAEAYVSSPGDAAKLMDVVYDVMLEEAKQGGAPAVSTLATSGRFNLPGLVGYPVKVRVTHKDPHFDEFVNEKLVRTPEGERVFPGVCVAETMYVDAASSPPYISRKEMVDSGILPNGVWGGMMDEHANEEHGRIAGECAATIAASAVGRREDPALQPILAYILARDTGKMPERAMCNYGDIYRLVAAAHKYAPGDAQKLADIAYDVMLCAGLRWYNVTGNEYKSAAQFHEIPVAGGKAVKLVALDRVKNNQLPKFARSKEGGEQDVIVQRSPSGNVQIFFNQKSADVPGFTNAKFAVRRAMRAEEARASEQAVPDETELSREGFVIGWYGEKDGMLLNGSDKAPNVPPTKLPMEQIVEIIQMCFSPNKWSRAKANDCTKGICSHTDANPCVLHAWGLWRCKRNAATAATDAFHAAEQAKNFAKLGLGRPTRR